MSNVTINQLPSASTIDPVQDLLPIFNNAGTATQAINRNTYLGLASAPVGLTDSQTLTNKTLTSPTLNTPTISSPTMSGTISGTYTIGGTPTFPASVVTLTGSQTLTNKTLTAPTITNATLTTDTITGFTTSNSGSVYGISVTTGAFSSSNIIPTAAIQANAVTTAKLATGSNFTPRTVEQNPYKFAVYRNAAWTATAATDVKVQFDTKEFDTSSNYDATTNFRFTAPIAGFYYFVAVTSFAVNADGTEGWAILYKNGVAFKRGAQLQSGAAAGVSMAPTVSGLLQLNATDYIEVFAHWNGGSNVAGNTSASLTYFMGYLVSAT